MSKRDHGFTLVELLVVIAIVAVLVTVLVPTLGKARESAHNVICQSNQRQIGLALTAYRTESDDFFPVMYAGPGVAEDTNTRAYPFRLVPYLWGYRRYSNGRFDSGLDTKKVGYHIFYCPSVPLYGRPDYEQPLRSHAWLYGPSWDYGIANYNMLSGLGYNYTATDGWMKLKRTLVFPEKTMLYVDGRNQVRIDHSFKYYQARHRGNVNIVMGDLHVESISEQELLQRFGSRIFHLYDPQAYRYAK